ncbi:C45 family autoproteolytic acyltransferase/hydolase [Pseudobacteroides cellulosolvens]|uniref:EF-hand domain-containing protein n=1 Tax=Pseudobacteroides cellulosolvens ATCC 35603 = DSM 2933 TaxID=398512 RepID=A0A0L6JNN4_9FIRM|nr:C45 family peptidase [Pseudobacteroides cellulosolvens]KNY27374.1 hypothetical protein Bccel_2645 [Pseudobacteroides cellulosolvens ATCC 35603 = DSM 2933]
MKKKISIIVLLIMLSSSIMSSACVHNMPIDKKESVGITDKGNYFEVNIDVKRCKTHWKVGEEYARKILKAVPDYERLVDSYLAECSGSDSTYQLYIKRVNDIKTQIPIDYINEIEGMASIFSGKAEDVSGDGKLSLQEIYMLNLFPDVARSTQCSALAVYGERSVSKKTIAERILDWYQGSQNQLAKLQAVITFKNDKKSICSIGYLGFMGVISGFNNDRVFAAILDSRTGQPYSSESKNSYPMDLRYSLENYKTIDGVANYLKAAKRAYSIGHLIFLCDPKTAGVLENNMSTDVNSLRDVRRENSPLNDGIEWGIDNSLGVVNSFMLIGNYDNHSSETGNVLRWDSMKNQLLSKGDEVTLDELKEIASYYTGSTVGTQAEGCLYNVRTQQIIVYEPSTNHLEVFFRPEDGVLPQVPEFERVKVKF